MPLYLACCPSPAGHRDWACACGEIADHAEGHLNRTPVQRWEKQGHSNAALDVERVRVCAAATTNRKLLYRPLLLSLIRTCVGGYRVYFLNYEHHSIKLISHSDFIVAQLLRH